MQADAPTVLLDSLSNERFSRSWRFSGYMGTLSAILPEQVLPVLQGAEDARKKGLYAAGFVAYEAAASINSSLPSLPPIDRLPLAWFAIFRERREVEAGEGLPEPLPEMPRLLPCCSPSAHAVAFSQIHDAIEKGETYQINHTFRMKGDFRGDPLALYSSLLRSQRPAFGAYIDMGRYLLISASPELFFSIDNAQITARPMKGTAPRGRFPEEDRAYADALMHSEKERAENLMIVDLLRNDLGQVAKTGTVRTESMFQLENYPTVHQMTSTITAELREGVTIPEVFAALFPCGSVTGAPKRSSMEIIAGIEGAPRGAYCGAIGCMAPEAETQFSVAIRTMLYDRFNGNFQMGVGSGITWSSNPAAEYAECIEKAKFTALGPLPPLLESILLDNGSYPFLERHLKRLEWSASRLGHIYSRDAVIKALDDVSATSAGSHKVRLVLSPDGEVSVDCSMLSEESQPILLGISSVPVNPDELLLYMKTTKRDIYESARMEDPEADEVLMVNARGELTEGTYNNIVLKLDGCFVTPRLSCGLLPGVMRSILLDEGKISEHLLYPADLERAEEIWLINSVRGWRPARIR